MGRLDNFYADLKMAFGKLKANITDNFDYEFELTVRETAEQMQFNMSDVSEFFISYSERAFFFILEDNETAYEYNLCVVFSYEEMFMFLLEFDKPTKMFDKLELKTPQFQIVVKGVLDLPSEYFESQRKIQREFLDYKNALGLRTGSYRRWKDKSR